MKQYPVRELIDLGRVRSKSFVVTEEARLIAEQLLKNFLFDSHAVFTCEDWEYWAFVLYNTQQELEMLKRDGNKIRSL